ncbi:hypothetical protein EDC01DRAFT_632573 [Geopyxis carbonaria]|nr:hypothetical protein EDC01DRAFT_632573 [Geopyxis carbonaria]
MNTVLAPTFVPAFGLSSLCRPSTSPRPGRDQEDPSAYLAPVSPTRLLRKEVGSSRWKKAVGAFPPPVLHRPRGDQSTAATAQFVWMNTDLGTKVDQARTIRILSSRMGTIGVLTGHSGYFPQIAGMDQHQLWL